MMETPVIASQRVRASRGPMTGSAKQSGRLMQLDCFVADAPRNDENGYRPTLVYRKPRSAISSGL
jgi:hypothetical protein